MVELASVRAKRRLEDYRRRITHVMETNRTAVGRLYHTGALFTREGARAGRDLLLAHQHLLRVMGLLNRLTQRGDVPAPRHPDAVDAVYGELDALLQRTGELTTRTGEFLEGLQGD